MSRLKKFTHSLVSGYVSLGVNIFYTLASVPLALHYLDKAEFGLWALVTQVGGYIALIDLGMGGSISRILIDHKDDRQNGAYGSVIKTSVLVGVTQGMLIILAGAGLSVLAGPLLHIPADLQHKFMWLLIGQSWLLALSFAGRIFNYVLLAHQHQAFTYYGGAGLFFVNLAGMWAGLAAGWGVYSFLIGQSVMTLGNIAVNTVGCARLKLLPHGDEWGAVTWQRFRELFDFGRDIFIYSLGSQLINASQIILLTRLLGLETAAAWTVGTRAYLVLTQVVYRIMDFSAPALSEMMVRGEKERLRHRFRQIAVLSMNMALATGAVFALCNSAFVAVWLKHKIAWPPVNDVLLAIWLVICVTMRTHIYLAGLTKKLLFMRYVFFIEGLAFVGLTLAIYRFGGIAAMLSASILCTLCLSLPYSLYRTHKYFNLNWRELAGWFAPLLRLAFWLLPAGALMWWFTEDERAITRLILRGSIFGLWTAWAFLRHGLSAPLQMEIHGRAPGWLKPILTRLGFAKSSI
ncbi:MAG TPA: oligosaccharide flippase family protein [Verrucomicrobiae bacterium]|nr:oligosaccharide flippase family protein [Verrucomicrobiae bacterium]